MKFSRDTVEMIQWLDIGQERDGITLVQKEFAGEGRWSIDYLYIVKYRERYFRLVIPFPATESVDYDFLDDIVDAQDCVAATEVFKKEIKKIIYVEDYGNLSNSASSTTSTV